MNSFSRLLVATLLLAPSLSFARGERVCWPYKHLPASPAGEQLASFLDARGYVEQFQRFYDQARQNSLQKNLTRLMAAEDSAPSLAQLQGMMAQAYQARNADPAVLSAKKSLDSSVERFEREKAALENMRPGLANRIPPGADFDTPALLELLRPGDVELGGPLDYCR